MGYVAHEVLITQEEVSSESFDRLFELWHCSDTIIVDKSKHELEYVYILEHSNARLSNEDVNTILALEEVHFITYDDTYCNRLTLYKSIKDDASELGYINEDDMLINCIDLTELIKEVGLNESTVDLINNYYNKVYS